MAGEPPIAGESPIVVDSPMMGEPPIAADPPITADPPMAADPQLSADERRSLRCLVGIMIPASQEYGVPGADDDAIFADIVASLGPDTRLVGAALRRLDTLCGGSFADRGVALQQSACAALRNEPSPLVTALVRVTVQCYYRDDQVMRSLNMEPRPPYPLGFEVESGDWSLLDPVRARGKIYRDAPQGRRD